MDLPTLGTNPNSKQHGSATQEAKDLGNLHILGKTVRVEEADCPWGKADHQQAHGGPSENATQTSSTAPRKMDRLWPTRGPFEGNSYCADVCDKQEDYLQTPCNQNQLPRRIKRRMRKNKQRTKWTQGLADCPHLPCGQRCSSSKTRSQPLLSIHGSLKWLELLRKDLGEMWSVCRGCCARKLEPLNELNRWESNRNRALPKG
jgi:hypothetical protein